MKKGTKMLILKRPERDFRKYFKSSGKIKSQLYQTQSFNLDCYR